MMKIGFLGAGKMAQALAKGFIESGLTKGELIVSSCAPQDTHCADAFRQMGAKTWLRNPPVVEESNVVVVAVKPQTVQKVLEDVAPKLTPKHLLLSIAMGVPIGTLEKNVPPGTRVIRVMPNTPCFVGAGASVFTPGSTATDEDQELTRKLFQSVGTCEQVAENQLDIVTALSGSGPAYIYLVIESLADGAVKMGMPRDLAYKLAAQTVVGAGKMVIETRKHPGELKDDVMSPGGSTAAAVHFLEQNNLRASLIGAIVAATQRCREQSNQ